MGLQMGVRSVHKALGIYARCQLESHLNQLGHMRLNVWHQWLRRCSPIFLSGCIHAMRPPMTGCRLQLHSSCVGQGKDARAISFRFLSPKARHGKQLMQ